MSWRPHVVLGFAAVAIGSAPDGALAQSRSDENAVTQAEDAFGFSVGRESLGIYNAGNVRGFSPIAAGNLRIDGLYFDQAFGPRLPVHGPERDRRPDAPKACRKGWRFGGRQLRHLWHARSRNRRFAADQLQPKPRLRLQRHPRRISRRNEQFQSYREPHRSVAADNGRRAHTVRDGQQ
jgi:hypothetical protein